MRKIIATQSSLHDRILDDMSLLFLGEKTYLCLREMRVSERIIHKTVVAEAAKSSATLLIVI